MSKALVVSAFPGTGKSHFYKEYKDTYVVLDSDSSKFDKTKFPANYIEHIKENIPTADIIFVSSHKDVRDALVENGIPFTLIYPTVDQKDIYLERYKKRGSPQAFIDLLEKNWYDWIADCALQEDCKQMPLRTNQFITDLLVL